MEPKACDHQSVGIFLRRSADIAVIFRKNYPQSYALPAGHLDGELSYEAAIKEAKEEVGILIYEQMLIHEGEFQNPCRRTRETYHRWCVYEALEWTGELRAGSDAAEASWMSIPELREKAHITRALAKELDTPLWDLASSTPLIVNHPWWQKHPGLEPIWYVMLDRMGLIFPRLPST